MLELNKKKTVGSPSRRCSRQDAGATLVGKLASSQVERVDREIASTDAEIDDLVYELYGTTEGERKTIEQS